MTIKRQGPVFPGNMADDPQGECIPVSEVLRMLDHIVENDDRSEMMDKVEALQAELSR